MAATVATADPMFSQSLDLGFLDNFDPMAMPELNEEMVPVDSFFNSYVENLELGAREGQTYAGQLARMETGDGSLLPPALSLPLPTNGLPAVPLSGGMPQATTQSAAMPLTNGSESSGANVASVSGFLPQTMPMPAMGAFSGDPAGAQAPLSSAPQMPQIPPTSAPSETTSARGGRSTRGARSGVARATAAISDESLHHLDHDKTKRNPKQQLQNKQAQQRYRERRKQRFQELEDALSQLTDQIQAKQYEMAGLQNQNAGLQGKTQELAQAMAARDAELAALKAQLVAATNGAGASSSDGHSSGTAHNETEAQGSAARVVTRSTLSDAEMAACRVQYDALVSAMRELAERNSLHTTNVLGEGVAPGVLAQVRELVQSGCRASQELERKGGIQVLEVMGRDVEKLGGHSCATERARWGRILEVLRLVPRQEEALLALRKQHLSKLKQIYHQRQSLNMQAMGMMLPSPGRSDVASRLSGDDPTLEGKMACMSIGSYLDCAHNTAQLDKTLDELKDNLRSEQTSFLELKLVVLHRVLSPIQTLLFVKEAYPTHADALALANSVALRLGRAAEGCPKAAELLKAASDEKAQAEALRGKGSAATSLGDCLGSRDSSLDCTDDSHKSDCCSLNRNGSG